MRKFDLSLRSSRSSYFATFRHQLTILSKTDALDEEKWLNMLGTFVKDLRLLNLLLRLVAFLLFLNPQCLASISRWITASSSWKRFCLFVCRALSSIMVICMLTAIRLLLTFVMSLYLLLRS